MISFLKQKPFWIVLSVLTLLFIFLLLELPAENKEPISTSSTPTTIGIFTPIGNQETTTVGASNKLATSSPEIKIDTSNWKTYTNKRWGYKLKYPEDWNVLEETVAITDFLAPGVETEPYIQDSSKLISITVVGVLQELVFPPAQVETKKISVGGIEGKDYYVTIPVIGTARWVVLEKDGVVFKLVVGLENPKTVEIFNQMLKTFEFIK